LGNDLGDFTGAAQDTKSDDATHSNRKYKPAG
jgi:hypothetical protein